MTTRLKYIIEQDDASTVEVDYDRAELGLWITQDDDRVWIEADAVEELRSAIFEQNAALENDIWEAEQAAEGAMSTSLATAPANDDSARQCESLYPGQGVTCRKAHGHTNTGSPVDRDHEGSDGTDDYLWEA